MNDTCLAFAFAAMLTSASATNAQVRLSNPTQWITVEDLSKLGKLTNPFFFGVSLDRTPDGRVSKCTLTGKSPRRLPLAICDIVKARVRYAPFQLRENIKPDFATFELLNGKLSQILDLGGASLINLFIDDSLYPREAIRQGQQGRVRAGFIIGENGRARDCHMITSSLSQSLDAETCAQILSNLKAGPPLNNDGKPVEVPAVVTVDWILPLRP